MNNKKRLLATLVSVLVLHSPSVLAKDVPATIDAFTAQGYPGEIVALYDPGFITITLDRGETIDTTYGDIDFDILYEWEQQAKASGKPRRVMVHYTLADGVTVKDVNSDIGFSLNGVIEEHPIDMAMSACTEQFSTTVGMHECSALAYHAWDRELNRAYAALGGSNNPELKAAQIAWIAFRDKQTEYLAAHYGKMQGSIWGLIYGEKVNDITRQQTEALQSMLSW
uniref:lysozyme inhibitor LprI family protein n=1 Tax=Thaumasiovibrio occultus TaxID=1891184 RepID=UPI000B360FB4|nr:lysozyme inhibitor LprI family protein [Thaumasiovibrio occultus]